MASCSEANSPRLNAWAEQLANRLSVLAQRAPGTLRIWVLGLIFDRGRLRDGGLVERKHAALGLVDALEHQAVMVGMTSTRWSARFVVVFDHFRPNHHRIARAAEV